MLGTCLLVILGAHSKHTSVTNIHFNINVVVSNFYDVRYDELCNVKEESSNCRYFYYCRRGESCTSMSWLVW